MRWSWMAFVLVGCFAETHRPICELDPEPVADDVEVAGVTAADLLATVEGSRVEAGSYDDGAAVDVTIDVGRAGGAEYVHTTPGTQVTRRFGVGGGHLMMYVPCGDYVRVPVGLRVTTADDALDIDVDTFVAGPMEGEAAWEEADVISISGDVRLDRATVPHGAEGDPADYEHTHAFARVDFPAEGPTTGHAGWGGGQETEEYSSSSAFYVLEW